jgi:hypothetical protein
MTETTTTTTSDPDAPSIPVILREFRQLLDERVEAEAKRARRTRLLGWMALALSLVAAVATAGILYFAFYRSLPVLASPSVTAREIVLVDGDGRERGLWTVDDDGAARLVLMDADGVARLKLTLNAEGDQGVSLAGADGTNRVVLGQLGDGSSTLTFADPGGTARVVLGMSGSEAGSLLFADRNGGARAALGLSPMGEPTFWWPEEDDTGAAPGAGSP